MSVPLIPEFVDLPPIEITKVLQKSTVTPSNCSKYIANYDSTDFCLPISFPDSFN